MQKVLKHLFKSKYLRHPDATSMRVTADEVDFVTGPEKKQQQKAMWIAWLKHGFAPLTHDC